MPTARQIGKYTLPIGTAALGGGALGYLAYKLSPERYKRLMGTLGAVVGAAVGAYGGYKLSNQLMSGTTTPTKSTQRPTPVATLPAVTPSLPPNPQSVATPPPPQSTAAAVSDDYTYDDNALAEKTLGSLGEDIGAEQASKARIDNIRRNTLTKGLNLGLVPQAEGFFDALGNSSTPELTQLNPKHWMYKGIGLGTDALIPESFDGMGGQTLRAGARVGGISLAETGLHALTKIPGSTGKLMSTTGNALSTEGTALDRLKAGVDTVNNIRKGLDDSHSLAQADKRAEEIEGHLGEHASPAEALSYALQRNLVEKGGRTALFGLSARGTGGIASATGLNLGLPLEDISAVAKEISRHAVAKTEREKKENNSMLSEWWRSVGADDLGTAWVKALGGGHGSTRAERARIDETNKISARPVDQKAEQKYINQLYAAVDKESPGLSYKERNRRVAEKLRKHEPVRLTNKQLRARMLDENTQSMETLERISRERNIPLKVLLNRAAKVKYGFEIW